MRVICRGPTSAEGESSSAKINIVPYFYRGETHQIVQRVTVIGDKGAELKYILRVSDKGKLTVLEPTPPDRIIPKFDEMEPAKDEEDVPEPAAAAARTSGTPPAS